MRRTRPSKRGEENQRGGSILVEVEGGVILEKRGSGGNPKGRGLYPTREMKEREIIQERVVGGGRREVL